MIDLTSRALPNTVNVNGRPFSINTDFRLWMRFEIEVARGDFPINTSYLFRSEVPKFCRIDELMVFSRPKQELPRSLGDDSTIVIDYEYDADYIYAAILGQYGIDLFEVEELHWHKFLALIRGLNESTRMREIMGYRCYKKNTDKNTDQLERLRYAWEVDRSISNKEIKEFSDLFS